MLLNNFDPEKIAIINASQTFKRKKNFPEVCVSCFSKKLLRETIKRYDAKKIGKVSNANLNSPIYRITHNGKSLAICMAITGAPQCVGQYEELVAMGMKKLVLFGTCGVLDSNIHQCSIIIPTAALRDEGTSFHYAKASDEIATNVNEGDMQIFESLLKEHNCNYVKGKTWTTDGFYRETKEKKKTRQKQGCISVEMEASAMAAFAQFREIDLFHFFYAADNLDCEKWDKRSLGCSSELDKKQRIADLAIEFASRIK